MPPKKKAKPAVDKAQREKDAEDAKHRKEIHQLHTVDASNLTNKIMRSWLASLGQSTGKASWKPEVRIQ